MKRSEGRETCNMWTEVTTTGADEDPWNLRGNAQFCTLKVHIGDVVFFFWLVSSLNWLGHFNNLEHSSMCHHLHLGFSTWPSVVMIASLNTNLTFDTLLAYLLNPLTTHLFFSDEASLWHLYPVTALHSSFTVLEVNLISLAKICEAWTNVSTLCR